jgi:cytochrome c556
MRLRRHVLIAVAVIVCSALVLSVVGAVLAQGSKNPVADRQRLMKLIGASWADIQTKVKAGNIEAVAANAETIAVTASHIGPMFPAGSATPESKAKPEIWQDFAKFEGLAKNMEAMASELRDAARAKDQAKVEAMVKEFGPTACVACHQPFRK